MENRVQPTVEDEANEYIKNNVYCSDQPIDEILDSLKSFQRSSDARKRKMLLCIIQLVLEYVNYVPVYPVWMVIKLAYLFSGLIEHDILSNDKDLYEVQTYILVALYEKPGSKMFSFGLMALERIKRVLFKHQAFCSQIKTIPCYHDLPEDIKKCVNFDKNGEKIMTFCETIIYDMQEYYKYITITRTTKLKPPNKTSNIGTMTSSGQPSILKPVPVQTAPVTKPSTHNDSASFRPNKMSNIGTMTSSGQPSIVKPVPVQTAPVTKPSTHNDSDKMMVPPENIRNKLQFIFNNLSQKNIKQQCADIKKHLNRKYLPWFSKYLMKRVVNEYELHSLYNECLECFGSELLNNMLVLETVKTIKILSKKVKRSSQTKGLLKNLGHWLGLLTLARNKPSPMDLEKLVKNSCIKGVDELLLAIPFVAKVLESSKKSKTFGPKTPVTSSVLKCLAKLHQTPNLKLVLLFEVEVLFKLLNIEIKDLLLDPCQ